MLFLASASVMQTSWDTSPATSFDTNNPTNSLWGLSSPLGEKKTRENKKHGKTGSLQQLGKFCCPGKGEGGGSWLPFPWDGGELLRKGLEEERQSRLKTQFGPSLAPS